MEELLKAFATTLRALGSSFVRPACPQEVPRDAPESGEWNGLVNDVLKLIPRYKDLYDRRKTTAKRSGTGGLEQHVYIKKEMTEFLNTCGILGPNTIPVDINAANLGLSTRALFTSALVSYIEAMKLKHPTEKKYILPDENLIRLYGKENFEALKTMKPKPRKKKKDAKPRKPHPKVVLLERNGVQAEHFSFDAIPTICNFFIVSLPPRQVTEAQKVQIDAVRKHLKSLTAQRQQVRDTQAKAERERKKQEKIQRAIVPTQILSLSLNYGAGGQQVPIQGSNLSLVN